MSALILAFFFSISTIAADAEAASSELGAAGAGDLASLALHLGSLTVHGRALRDRLDATRVEQLWLAHECVDWRSGEATNCDHRRAYESHCSAFAAQAGLHNYLSATAKLGFADHPSAFAVRPDGTSALEYWAHAVDWKSEDRRRGATAAPRTSRAIESTRSTASNPQKVTE